MASHALETLILLFLFNITPYMEDRRGPLAPDSGLIGPGWGGIVPNRRINFVLSLGGPIRIPL